ncbi:MAG: hypothetical protein CL624_04460 [Arcobacter sp.]|nr:hypothetical protein [Arcobacter sp.]|tara:strand:- start:3710 stop:4318 length:609 start_codon:yes stop_codon:yes gene_type:complete
MYIVYLYNFLDNDKVFVGLSDNFSFHLDLEKKYFDRIGFVINSIDVVYFSMDKKLAIEEKEYWLAKTNNINTKMGLKDIPTSFISKSLKNKSELKTSTEELESEYMQLFYKYETIRENYKNLDEIIEQSIQEEIDKWKDRSLNHEDKDYIGNNSLEFDENGFDSCGFDREGYDKDGYDLDGYNREGFDDYGYNKDDIHKSDL